MQLEMVNYIGDWTFSGQHLEAWRYAGHVVAVFGEDLDFFKTSEYAYISFVDQIEGMSWFLDRSFEAGYLTPKYVGDDLVPVTNPQNWAPGFMQPSKGALDPLLSGRF